MSTFLYLITNKNIDVLSNKVLRVFKKHDYKREEIEKQTVFAPKRTAGLFNNVKNAIWLDLSNEKDFKYFKENINDKLKKDILRQDVIISTTILKGISPIEKIVEGLQGTIIKEKESTADDLLSDYPLSNNTKEVIRDFMGYSPNKILPLLNTLDSMTEEKIRKISPNDIALLLPETPGDIPPYEYLRPFVDGNIKQTISDLDRSLQSIHPLLLLSMLKNKIKEIVSLRLLILAGKTNHKEIGEIMSLHPYPVKLMWYISSNEQLTNFLSDKILELESNMKGNSVLPLDLLFKKGVVEMVCAISSVK